MTSSEQGREGAKQCPICGAFIALPDEDESTYKCSKCGTEFDVGDGR